MSGFFYPQDTQNATSRIVSEAASGPKTGFIDNFGAALDENWKDNQTIADFSNLAAAYGDRVQDIEKRTGKRLKNPMLVDGGPGAGDMLVPGHTVKSRRQLMDDFESEAEKLRKDYPEIITRDQMVDNIRQRVYQAVDTRADIADRATWWGKAGSFFGDMVGAITDPPVAISMLFGAPKSSGILRTALIESGIGAASEALVQPKIQSYRNELGLKAGFDEGLKNVAMASAGSFLFTGAVKVAAKGFDHVAGRKLINEFDKTVKNPTAEQRTARDAYEAATEIDEANPHAPGLKGMREHQDRFEEAAMALHQDRPARLSELSAQPIARDFGQDHLDGLIFKFAPGDVEVDARTFQFKEGGDDLGVTDRLKNIEQWDPVKAGQILVFEAENGKRFIADGHQRLGLAKKIMATDPEQKVSLYGQLFREADGFTPEQMRVIAAMKNVAEGTGTAVDAAKVLRIAPERIAELPPNSALVRQAGDLVNLDDEAFRMVVNELVPPNYAAVVGRLAPDDAQLQRAILGVLAKTDPANVVQAEAIVRQAMDAGVVRETQLDLFGEEMIASSLYAERARILDKSLKKLRQDKKVFDTLVRNQDRIEAEGNVLSRDANATQAAQDARAVAMVQILANRKGALSDALTNAAKRAKDDGHFRGATNDFINAVRGSAERGDFDGITIGDAGRIVETAHEGGARAAQPEPRQDHEAVKLFDEPAGRGQQEQGDFLKNDIQREISAQRDLFGDEPVTDDLLDMEIPMGERVDPETGDIVPEVRTVRDILADLDADDADLEAISRCAT